MLVENCIVFIFRPSIKALEFFRKQKFKVSKGCLSSHRVCLTIVKRMSSEQCSGASSPQIYPAFHSLSPCDLINLSTTALGLEFGQQKCGMANNG